MITRVCVLAVALLFAWTSAYCGQEVMAEFKDKRAKTPEVLSHVPLKAVVSEFLDPQDSGLGKSVSYLIWREVLTAISDQAGAGVIVAEAPPGERLVDLLKKDYHEAAERIGRHQRARMVVWGAVEEEGDELFIEGYLSTLTENNDSGLRLGLDSSLTSRPGRRSEEGDGPTIEASISHKRFNFATAILSRSDLFERTLVTAATVKIHESPDFEAKTLIQLPPDKAIQAVDMVDAWFKVRLPTGGFGYVHAGSFGNLRLPPRTVIGERRSVNLRAGPGTNHARVQTTALQGSYRVLDMRYREGHGLWYRVDLGPEETWVAAWLVEPRYSLPMVHFVAGLYRYYGERHSQSIEAFEQFIEQTDPVDDNVNLAAAHQLLGASQLLHGSNPGSGYQQFSRAIELTPFSPNAYLLRSLASLGGARPQEALGDLEYALQLDADFEPARRMAAAMDAVASQGTYSPLGELTRLPFEQQAVDRLLERFQIPPADSQL